MSLTDWFKTKLWNDGQHPRKKGPGIRHFQGQTLADPLLSQAERAKSFQKYAPDAPAPASRTMPASWGRT